MMRRGTGLFQHGATIPHEQRRLVWGTRRSVGRPRLSRRELAAGTGGGAEAEEAADAGDDVLLRVFEAAAARFRVEVLAGGVELDAALGHDVRDVFGDLGTVVQD